MSIPFMSMPLFCSTSISISFFPPSLVVVYNDKMSSVVLRHSLSNLSDLATLKLRRDAVYDWTTSNTKNELQRDPTLLLAQRT